MIRYSLFVITALLLVSCTKDVPKEMQSNNQQNNTEEREMPDDSIHRQFRTDPHNPHGSSGTTSGNEKEEWRDEKADQIAKVADEYDEKYQRSKSASDKKECIQKQLEAANYLMFEADLPPKEKYKPALQRYKRVLELDPRNEEAIANKEQIEEIYRSLGKPIPN